MEFDTFATNSFYKSLPNQKVADRDLGMARVESVE